MSASVFVAALGAAACGSSILPVGTVADGGLSDSSGANPDAGSLADSRSLDGSGPADGSTPGAPDGSGTSDGGICSLNELIKEPIVPPRYAAALDLAGGTGMPGLTLLQAEQINCPCAPLGDIFGLYADAGPDASSDGAARIPSLLSCAWGSNQEVIFSYDPGDQKGWMLSMEFGYQGAVGCIGDEPGNAPSGPCQPLQSPDKAHTYVIPIGSQVQKDNANFEIDWLDPINGPVELSELGAALLATYGPQLPGDANCVGDGRCTLRTTGANPYFGVPELGFYMFPSSVTAAQPVPSIITNIQLYRPCTGTSCPGPVPL